MSSRDWSEFNSDGESSVHGNPIPDLARAMSTPQQAKVSAAQEKVEVSENLSRQAVENLTKWRNQEIVRLIGETPAWWAGAVEAESYLDMSFQGQYSDERLEKEVIDAGAPSLKLFIQEEKRQSKIRIEVTKVECPKHILTQIESCAELLADAKENLKSEQESAISVKLKLPPSDFVGWIICPTREDAESLSSKNNFYRYDGQSRNARDKMVLTCSQAERLTHPKNKEKYIPENVFVYNESLIVSIGFGIDLQNVKKRIAESQLLTSTNNR